MAIKLHSITKLTQITNVYISSVHSNKITTLSFDHILNIKDYLIIVNEIILKRCKFGFDQVLLNCVEIFMREVKLISYPIYMI